MEIRHVIGQACALGAAFTWAFALVLFKVSGEKVAPVPLNLFKNVVALVLFGLTLAVVPSGSGQLKTFLPADYAVLILSGVIGIAVADTLFFHALNLIGVGLISIVDCLYSPAAILFSLLLIFEQLAPAHYIGAALIIGGVFVSSRHDPPPNRTRAQLIVGSLLAALAVAAMAFGIVLAKPVLDEANFPLLWAVGLRLMAGTLALSGIVLASPKRNQLLAVFRPSRAWKFTLPASVLGSYVCLILWMAGFKYTYASVAAVLNQMSVIFALILAAVVLKERFTRRKLVAVVLATGGVVLISIHSAGAT